ncbi:MAG: signal transduction protein [Gallionellaceae bacterium]|nr:MAG: signal transduction protein [Gallionellaceae bacterium]
MTTADDLRLAVRDLNNLPAMPVIAHKLLALKLETDEGERQMMLLIEQDPLISAKIIGLANSPLIGASRKITTVKEASLLLGLKKVKSVATGIAMMTLVSKPIGRFDPQEFWLHNMAVAFAMLPVVRAMPPELRPADDLIFLTGMLHDIGFLALAHLNDQLSDDLLTRMLIEPERLVTSIEDELMGISHAELGAEFAQHWGLPSEIVAVLHYHHTPDAAGADEGFPLARIINVTEKLLSSTGLHEFVGYQVSDEEWAALGIDPDDAEEITSQAAEQADQALQFAATF